MRDTPLWHYRWILLVGLAALMYILAFCIGYDPALSGESVLGTLARVQAAIFAIVFSIVILGVQLSASRYSPRLASTFKSDSGYRWTVGIFGFSIGLNILGLYLMNSTSESILLAIILLSGAIAIGAFWTLYDFVNDVLEKTTPEGILKEIKRNMIPESIVEEAHRAAEDTANRDPFLILVNVILSAIAEGDRTSASHGLSILGDRVTALLREASSEEFEEDSPVDQSLEELCVDHLPNIAEEAADEDLNQTVLEVPDRAEEIGKEAVEQDLDRVVEHVVRGQSTLVDGLDFEMSDERVRSRVIKKNSNILMKAADQGVWEGAAVGSRVLGWRAAASIMNRVDEGFNPGYSSLLVTCFPKILSKAVGSNEEINDHFASEWIRAMIMEDFSSVELLIGSSYSSMAELTSAALRYELREDQRIVEWNVASAGWIDGMNTLAESELQSMRKLWFGTVLYLEYLRDVTPDDVMSDFTYASTRVDPDFADETVDQILDGQLDPSRRIDFVPGSIDPVEMPLTGSEVPPIENSDYQFEDWLEQQRHMFGSSRRN